MMKKGYLLHDYGGEIEVEEVEILTQWGDEVVINSSSKSVWSSVGGAYEPKSRNGGFKTMKSLKPIKDSFSITPDHVMLTMDEVKEEIKKMIPNMLVQIRSRIKNNKVYEDALLNKELLATLPVEKYVSIITGKEV